MMTGQLFDVFVVGSLDPSDRGVGQLAMAIASRHGISPSAVEKAIAAGNLRAGQNLDRGNADRMADQLNALGALTDVRRIRTGNTGIESLPSGLHQVPSGIPQVPSALHDVPSAFHAAPAALKPLTQTGPSAFAAREPGTIAGQRTGVGLAPLQTQAGPGPILPSFDSLNTPPPALGLADPFAPPPSAGSNAPAGALPASAFAPPGAANVDTFAPPGADGGEMPLELDLKVRGESGRGQAQISLAGTAGLNSGKITVSGSSSHLEVGGDAERAHSTRCPEHGLYYDKRKSSGCRRCMEGARGAAASLERKMGGLAGFRENPARRGFAGLGLALIVGFLPAAYYALGPSAAKVKQLRAEQDELSRRTGTQEVLSRFDAIDEEVRRGHKESARNTALVWFGVSALSMVGWYRLTA